MTRKRKFKPPTVSDPPSLVEVEWVDAVYDTEHDGPASTAGGLALLPSCGYHVRTARSTHGTFVVLSREWSRSTETGELHSRHEITIRTDWIVRWSVVSQMDQIWPELPATSTSTSPPPPPIPNSSMTSDQDPTAGVSPKDSESPRE